MNHLSFGRKEEGGLGTRIPFYRLILEYLTNFFSMICRWWTSRSAAGRATGTTHKVLLYHFDEAADLLRQAIFQLRERRISRGLAAAG